MKRDLHQVKDKLNQTGYYSKLHHHAIPSGTQLVSQVFVLLQDNDSKHTSKLCQRYIKSKEKQHVLQLQFNVARDKPVFSIYKTTVVLNLLNQK